MPDTKTLAERGIDASAAYLERCGMDVGEVDYEHGLILAIDQEYVVLATVEVRDRTKTLISHAVLDEANPIPLAVMAATAPKARIDKVSIMVIATDRAILRHERNSALTFPAYHEE
jgi:hypothetical protein